ncbi:MAG: beta-N-acetylhexosaminidase [Nitrospirota bacterium]|nr:beta-N-acetylhexosaminidase [Nitrospirota bacterium]MDP2384085.1 beta-N-acetylhexosaminidase [Nitrospirota bacterium]MDP3596224.1 beta-N-acetylhexosaminidase [Nitrospirota bacterium]
MTTRDKIGQLFMVGFLGTSVTRDLASFIKEYKPGGVILFSRNLESVEQMVDLTNDLQACSPHSPLLISIDQEGGRVSRLPKGFTIFPPCELLGRANSTELAYAAAATIAKELRAVGVNMNMAPVLDVNSNPDNPVIGDRAFGATPDVVCELGLATAAGLQDNNVVACGKHFPGHGDTNVDSHKELPVVAASRERLETVEFPPFRRAVTQGIASMMTAHVLYRTLDPELPATLSPTIINGLLRQELRYDGVVLTDDLEMHAIIDHYGIEDAAVRAMSAGCDVLLICKDRDREIAAFEAVEQAVASGTISMERLSLSASRIARLKGRFVLPYKPVTISDAKLIAGCRSHQMLLRTIDQVRERLSNVAT